MQQDSNTDPTSGALTEAGEAASAAHQTSGSDRNLALTKFVSANDVQRVLGCSKSHAYEHLRRATGKTGRGLLRASVEVWEAYARSMFGGGSTAAGATATKDDEPLCSLQAIEAPLDEAYTLLDELRAVVAHCRRSTLASTDPV
jgi:hypothetical protein